jgi:hypothetical protein
VLPEGHASEEFGCPLLRRSLSSSVVGRRHGVGRMTGLFWMIAKEYFRGREKEKAVMTQISRREDVLGEQVKYST